MADAGNKTSMKIMYAGAPEFSVAPLKALLEEGFSVAAVLTQPDKPAGRKGILTPTPLRAFAEEAGIPVLTYAKVRDHVAELGRVGADILVTCAYGQILTAEVLAAFPKGVYNIHASLLPRWRGASPIQHAILAGDEKTGVTVMRTDIGLDTGDILLSREIGISREDTAESLSAKLSALGGVCIGEALRALERGEVRFVKQPEAGVTVCKKISKEMCAADFTRTAEEICRLVRAMAPSPLAYAYLRGKLVNFYFAEALGTESLFGAGTGGACAADGQAKSLRAGEVVRADKTGLYVAAGEGIVRITELQAEGGKRMRAADFVNGRKAAVGDLFTKEKA